MGERLALLLIAFHVAIDVNGSRMCKKALTSANLHANGVPHHWIRLSDNNEVPLRENDHLPDTHSLITEEIDQMKVYGTSLSL
ncbi:hypothetical protein KIN20_002542 [Parelaphostrongylus tenuis]|uniref:Uncharacterized protein n=1 Tax=Parelaphostrongylus tenuis TaxID=148309 RepID=A0AAD5MGT4_PARTN|nr:hypothetical protein KIN20_002542 [Parelaphostrongylus tenuis]